MKGFPNQVSDLSVLTRALRVYSELLHEGQNPRDDGVFGESLIRQEVLGTGHTKIPIEEYLKAQKKKPRKSDQSFRTRARGLRELFRHLSLIVEVDHWGSLTTAGQQIAALNPDDIGTSGVQLWRDVILKMTLDGETGTSHPYQVLLRLVAKRPGISSAKCALALEANDDSEQELERIAQLADLTEQQVIETLGISESNWKNAKKILPQFAEQLQDVRKVEKQQFYLADAPGASGTIADIADEESTKAPRKPKSSSRVTAETIARAGTLEGWDEAVQINESELDPESLKLQKEKLKERLRRHNKIVQHLAAALQTGGAELFENPFDCLACFDEVSILGEIKTLDGTEADEVARVRAALAQLLYYEAFLTHPHRKELRIRKVACFESRISEAHINWLESQEIAVIWQDGKSFDATETSREMLAGYFGF